MTAEFIRLTQDNREIHKMSVLASGIIKEYYDPVVGAEQNDYMIKMFQSEEAIKNQLSHGYRYYFVMYGGEEAGFIAFYPRENDMYLSKLYLKTAMRGKGIARDILRFISAKARKESLRYITLNVNKKNRSIDIYEHMGFTKIADEKNDIGSGYFMDDYVYRYEIR